VGAWIPAEDAGGPLAGMRIFEVEGILRPVGLTLGGRAVGEPLRLRRGRVVALPANYEPLTVDPVLSMSRAVASVAPIHMLVAIEFVPRDARGRAMEVLAEALGEGDPALRTAATSAVALLAERSVGEPVAPLAAPLVGALARYPGRSADVMEALRTLSGTPLPPDPRLWSDWWRRAEASGALVTAPEDQERGRR
jgi:hypothetical protein